MATKSSDLLIKYLLYILIFLLIVLLFLLIFIVPSIKTYRTKSVEYKNLSYEITAQKLQKQKLQKKLKNLIQTNKKIILSFNNGFDKNKFLVYTKQFFSEVTLVEDKNRVENGKLLIYEFNATSNMTTPENFYKFLDGFSSYENIIQVNFPITFTSSDKQIKTSFKINIYELNSSKK